jgi:GNAT superfamily N-acetyltransferase
VDADAAERVAMDDEPECEGFERIDRGDVRYKLGADPLPWSNGVAYARWRPEVVEERATELIAMFRSRGLAFTWQIGPNTDAVGLSNVLAAHGLHKEVDALLLTAKIPIRGRPRENDVRLVEEHDERTATHAIRIERDRTMDEVRSRVEARLRYLKCPTRRGGGVVAYRGELPVGYGRWRYGTDGDTVFLHTGATLQPHRRTGVYTALLEWRLERAVRDGKTTAVIVAERASSAPILMRKGFRDVGAMQIWMAV